MQPGFVKLPSMSVTPAQTQHVLESHTEYVSQTPAPFQPVALYNSQRWNRTIIYYRTGPPRGGSSADAIMRSGEHFSRDASEALFVHATFPRNQKERGHHRRKSSSDSSKNQTQLQVSFKNIENIPPAPAVEIGKNSQLKLVQKVFKTVAVEPPLGRLFVTPADTKSIPFCFKVGFLEDTFIPKGDQVAKAI